MQKNHQKSKGISSSDEASGNTLPSHVAMLLPDLRIGGAERVTVALANAMARMNIKVDVVLLREIGPFIHLLDKRITVVGLGAKRVRNSAVPLIRYLRQHQPDVLFAHMYPLTSVSVVSNAIAASSTKIVVIEHTDILNAAKFAKKCLAVKWAHRFLVRLTYPRAQQRIAVSEGAARSLEIYAKLKPKSVLYIPNAVELSPSTSSESAEAEALWPFGNSACRIISVGNLKSVKNYGYLLGALALASKERALQLLLIGDGDERLALEEYARKLGIQDRVVFAGSRRNPTAFLQSAEIFALSSKVEGLPTVIIEALLAGLKIVSTDCESGPREILCPQNVMPYGLLVPIDDLSAFSQAIVRSIDSSVDPSRQKAGAVKYSPESIAAEYLAQCTS